MIRDPNAQEQHENEPICHYHFYKHLAAFSECTEVWPGSWFFSSWDWDVWQKTVQLLASHQPPMTCGEFQLNNTYRRCTFIAKAELRCSLNPSQIQIFTECEWQGSLIFVKKDFALKLGWVVGVNYKLLFFFFHLRIYYKSMIIYYT